MRAKIWTHQEQKSQGRKKVVTFFCVLHGAHEYESKTSIQHRETTKKNSQTW